MNDLTVLYYSACRIAPYFADGIRAELLNAIDGKYPIISVTHRPVEFGRNICVGDVQPSAWQVYMNVLIGARAATTDFIACAEDDSLYCVDFFATRPGRDVFGYQRNRWVISRRLSADGKRRDAFYYFRVRTQFAQCIANRELMIETLEERFAAFPKPIPDREAFVVGWGEPGRYERRLGLRPRKREYFETAQPNVTFNHSASIRGRRQAQSTDLVCTNLEPWGNADELWKRIVGD